MVKFLFLLQSWALALELTPQQAAEKALATSFRKDEINLEAQKSRYILATAEKKFDFALQIESGNRVTTTDYLLSPTAGTISKTNSLETKAAIVKPFFTGTKIGAAFSRISAKQDAYGGVSIPNSTTDSMTFSLEQNLLYNSFGIADRAELRSAEASTQAAEYSRSTNLQGLALDGLRKYWNAYVAQETFQEAITTRERYQKLVGVVKRKNSMGYANPGEFSQVQAEYENREQKAKSSSANYLKAVDELLTLLQEPPETEIKFVVPKEIPALPQLAEKELQSLRPIKAAQLSLTSAEESLRARKSRNVPDVSLVGSVGSVGLERTPDSSYSEMIAGGNPNYYMGVRFIYTFGSGGSGEEILNARILRDIEQSKLNRQLRETADKEKDLKRQAVAAYANTLSLKQQLSFRERANNELNRSYSQGRTNINDLINAMNAYSDAQIQYVRSLGDYQIALNEWAAFRDELIPEMNPQGDKK